MLWTLATVFRTSLAKMNWKGLGNGKKKKHQYWRYSGNTLGEHALRIE
jgi:hypothetical protein